MKLSFGVIFLVTISFGATIFVLLNLSLSSYGTIFGFSPSRICVFAMLNTVIWAIFAKSVRPSAEGNGHLMSFLHPVGEGEEEDTRSPQVAQQLMERSKLTCISSSEPLSYSCLKVKHNLHPLLAIELRDRCVYKEASFQEEEHIEEMIHDDKRTGSDDTDGYYGEEDGETDSTNESSWDGNNEGYDDSLNSRIEEFIAKVIGGWRQEQVEENLKIRQVD